MRPDDFQWALWKARDLVKRYQIARLSPYKCSDGSYTIGYGRKAVWNEAPYSVEQCEELLLNDLAMRAAKFPGGIQARELAAMVAVEHLSGENCRALGRHESLRFLQNSSEPWAAKAMFLFLEGKLTP